MKSNLLSHVALLVALLAFSGCASLGIAVGAPPGEEAVQVKSYIKVQRPAVSSLTVEVAKSSYTEMLNKGYARMGTIQCDTYIGTHDSAKQYLLRESQKNGAEVAWIVMYDNQKSVKVGEAGSGTGWSGGSFGQGHMYSYSYKEKYLDYKYITGIATLFVRDPALAARQLKEGKALWEAVAAGRKEEQQILIGKLSKMEDTIRGYDDSLFGEDLGNERQDVLDRLTGLKTWLVTGKSPSQYNYGRLTYEKWWMALSNSLPYSWRYGKHIKQAKQAVQLMMDVEQYAKDNRTLFDYYKLLESTDKILLY
ncbi:MAG: hypothetical protein HY026_06355 [Deltaproteobacteria bacterium]|nr:hypothetical protein [Deltaproteobacteria bacterium]